MPVFDTYDDSGFISTLDVGVDPILEADFLRPQSPWYQRFAFGFVFDGWQTASEQPQGTVTGPISFVQEAWGNTLFATLSGFPVQGNLLIAVGFNNSSPPGLASGWNAIDTDNGTYAGMTAWKFAGASEPKLQTPFTGTSTSTTVMEFSSSTGFPANPIDGHNTHESATHSPPAVGSPVLTSTQINDLFLFAAFQFSTSNTAPSSLTNFTTILQLNSVTQTGPTGNGIIAYQQAPALGGYSGICAWTGSTTEVAAAFGILIKANPVQKFAKAIVSTQNASITPSGLLNRFIAYLFTAGEAATAALNTVYIPGGTEFFQTLTAGIASSGVLPRVISSLKTAGIASSGALNKAISWFRTASIASAGAIAKQTARAFTAIVKFQLVDTIVDFTTGSAATATNISMTFPKGSPQQGDLLIAFMSVQGNTGSLPTTNSGWTQISLGHGNGPLQMAAFRVAGVSESATQTPFDNLTNQTGFGGMFRILTQGVTTVDASAYNGILASGSLAFTLTPTSSYGIALGIISDTSNVGGAGQWTLPSGWTNQGFANGFQTNFSFAFNVPQGANSLTFTSSNSTFNMSGMLINVLGAAPLQRAISALKTAGISSSGALKRAIAVLRTAGIASSGAFQKLIATAKTAGIASSGVLTTARFKLVAFTASIASSATIQNAIHWFRSASIASTGTENRSISKHQTATITSSGTFSKLTKWFRTAQVTSSGALKKSISYLFTATEAASASISFIHTGGTEFFQTFTASMAGGATLTKAVTKGLTAASLSMSASFAKSDNKILTATITSAATLGRSIRKGLTAVTVASAATHRQGHPSRASVGLLHPGGSLSSAHTIVHAVLTASKLGLSGSLGMHRIFHRIFTAIVSSVGSLVAFFNPKKAVAQFGVPMSATAQVGASISAELQAGTPMSAELQVPVELSASAEFGTPMTSEAQFAAVQGAS